MMSSIRKGLKKMFPAVFEQYKHLMRIYYAYESRKKKKLSLKQQREWINTRYKKRIGTDMNWENPTTYTEKMQWSKLYDRNPLKTLCADKYKVRAWVKEKIGEEYLIPMLGVWDKFEDIDFQSLPKSFVLKTNHGSGTNIIVKNKETLNYKNAKCRMQDWLATDYGYKTLELHYSDISPKIIAEQYVESDYGELQDYKFLCFMGKAYYCWVDMGRYTEHTRNVYDLGWKLQPWNQEMYAHYKEPIPMPKDYDKMVELAEILSQEFSHVRVDLYNVNGKIYFGEMTFTNGGGFDRILPFEYNQMLGDLWEIQELSVQRPL